VNCETARTLISAAIDGELAPQEQREFDEHVSSCASCAADLQRFQAVSRAVRESAPRYSMPPGVLDAVRVRVGRPRPLIWQPFGLGALAGVALASLVAVALISRPSASLAAELLDEHVRSLQGSHLVDVVSSDRHTVKPWFEGKLDFAPTVRDFASQGYSLVGGRLEYLDGHAAAGLVYRHGLHVINLFVFSVAVPAVPAELRGYHFASWRVGELQYVAVSDTDQPELDRLKSLYLSPN